MRRLSGLVFLGFSVVVASLSAQSRPPLVRADYGQWESLGQFLTENSFSPDGAWLAYSITRSDRTSELRFRRLSDNTEKVAAFGSGHAFSSDNTWAAFSTGYSEAEQERMRTARQPIQNKMGLLSLASGEISTVDAVQSFAFSGDGKFLIMRRYAPVPPAPVGGGAAAPAAPGGGRGAGPGNADETPAPGVTVILRELATGRDTTFGNVSESVWQNDSASDVFAMTISAEGQSGNGVHLFDASSGVLRVLDSAATTFSNLVWRENSADLVVLRARTDEKRDGPAQNLLAWRGLGTAAERRFEFDPAAPNSGVADGMRTTSFRRPSWTEDGRSIFVGLAAWNVRATPPARDGGAGAGPGPAPKPDEPAGVDIWHWQDPLVLARQKLTAAGDRRRTFLAVWHPDTNGFARLTKSHDEAVTIMPRAARVLIEDGGPYAMARSIGRQAADLYVADLATGRRTPLRSNIDDSLATPSPGGKYVLFVDGGHYWTIDLATGAATNITGALKASLVDVESDSTGPAKPMFGTGGWTRDDQSVLIYDKYDIWQVAPDGKAVQRLTNGAVEGLRHRVVRLDTRSPWIDGPTYVSLFGLRSKRSGYGQIAVTPAPAAPAAAGSATVLVLREEAISGLAKARKADVAAYVSQRHDDSPDIFVADASLQSPRAATSTNTFQSNYAWSKSELIEYKTASGQALQGALYYPAGYQPGRTYPMIVYMYEKLSDGVHRYVAPSDQDYYNTTVFTSNGFFVLQPDIVFRPREPGVSVVECVTAAVKRVVDLGLADPRRVGAIGHSWGGFDTAFLATNTTGVFAAAVAGAAITNLVSNYGNHHWSSGIAETDHIETGQQRMAVPLYDDLQAYIRNSAVYNVHKMTVPLMLMTGDNDGTVYWHQAVEMYNIARRAGKNVVMLVYNGEDHGLRQRKNQVDYQQRILAWFGHYLKGEHAPAWVTSGQTFLDREAEVKRGGSRE